MYKYEMRAMKGGTESGDESTALFEADIEVYIVDAA